MAKKNKQKRQVLLDVDEDWFKLRGTNKHFGKYIWHYIAAIIIPVLVIVIDSSGNKILAHAMVALEVVVFMVCWYNLIRAGKAYWRKYKDVPSPLHLKEGE